MLSHWNQACYKSSQNHHHQMSQNEAFATAGSVKDPEISPGSNLMLYSTEVETHLFGWRCRCRRLAVDQYESRRYWMTKSLKI